MDTSWIKHNFKENKLICERCKAAHDMPDKAVDIRMFVGIMEAFGKIHIKCKQNEL